MPSARGPRLGALLAAASLLAACGSPVSEVPPGERPVPAPVWAPPGADLAVALAPELLRGTDSARFLLAEALRLLRPRLPELADGLQQAGGVEAGSGLFVISMAWRDDGSHTTTTGPVPTARQGGSRTLSGAGPEPFAALVHVLPARLPSEALVGLPQHLRRVVRSLRRVGLALRAREAFSLSGRAEAPGEEEAASLASILRGLAESSGAGARARGDVALAGALAALRIENRGPVVVLEARLDAEQARALLRSASASP